MINAYEMEDGVVFDMSVLECEALRSYADGLLTDPDHPFVELLRGQGLVESCERVGLLDFVKVGQRCQVRQRSEAGQWRQVRQGIELGQDEGVDPARGLLAACAR